MPTKKKGPNANGPVKGAKTSIGGPKAKGSTKQHKYEMGRKGK